MRRIYNPECFAARIDFAANVMRKGQRTSREFDTCFEMSDGDQVVTMLWRKAQTDTVLHANFDRYLSLESVKAAAEARAHLTDEDIARQAAEARTQADIQFEKLMIEMDRIQTGHQMTLI